MRHGVVGALLCCALLATACSDDLGDPVAQPTPTPVSGARVFNPDAEPAEAVLVLVPEAATILAVTDYSGLRAQLDQSELTSKSPAADRARFWRALEREAVVFSPGLLREDDELLLTQYGFTQDDVSWEARFGAPTGEGFVLAFRDDLDFSGVERAVADGVGALDGADVDADSALVTLGTTGIATESWAADPDRADLVGQPAGATYVDTACLPSDIALAGADLDDLTTAEADDVSGLDDLGPFSVSYGGELVTVRLGPMRNDVFARAELPDVLVGFDPDFTRGYVDPVADPDGGRIGYRIGDPQIAESLARQRRLPFAVCPT